MHARATGGKFLILCALILLGATNTPSLADTPAGSIAAGSDHTANRGGTHEKFSDLAQKLRAGRGRAKSISCVPFARADSVIDVFGNAWQWWEHAAGIYARGRAPEVGSVLSFRSIRHMRLGHVAVVSRIMGPREIEVDQANWPRGSGVKRGVSVIDVSAGNDWTAVRVEIGDSGHYGSTYPTNGFIYGRADSGRMLMIAGLRH